MSEFKLKNGYTLGVLACGTMGTAVLNATVQGLKDLQSSKANSDACVPGKFLAAVNSIKSKTRLQETFGTQVDVLVGDNSRLVEESDVIILGCKPFMAEKILSEISSKLFQGKILISLLAGKTIAQLSKMTSTRSIGDCVVKEPLVVRCMTNTPSQIGAGMTVVSFPDGVEVAPEVRSGIDFIFKTTGRCLFLEEKHQNVATALCGSGPALMYVAIEALCDGAVRMGLPYDLAKECAAQVLVGSGKMVLKGDHPAVLKSQVCTPGGTTIAGLMEMEDRGVRSAVAHAVIKATEVAKELSG